MSVAAAPPLEVIARNVSKRFRRNTGEAITALSEVSLDIRKGALTALVGPDGGGKTTFIRLIAGLMPPDTGQLSVAGIDVVRDPQSVQDRIAYMPQKFGLYEDLSVQENLDLYADLHGVIGRTRKERYAELLEMTALGPFTRRLAGKLSGGMKQKLGLACTLVRTPDLLLLDEPTAGVDPLSRRELWAIILQLIETQDMSVLVSTSYLDEAERCQDVIVLRQGEILAQGSPGSIGELAQGRVFLADPPPGQSSRVLAARLLASPDVIDAVPEAGRVRFVAVDDRPQVQATIAPVAPRFEDGFMTLLRRGEGVHVLAEGSGGGPTARRDAGDVAIAVRDLVRTFGSFTAVNHVSFEVHRGEIFGLLGPNGAGKTTTFRMLCGLLSATAGTLHVAGVDVAKARASARQYLGYVAQKFSLYGQLSVAENLDFFANAYGLHGSRKRARIEWAMQQFDLREMRYLPSEQLPGGYKQRLAMAVALLHEPAILFLDEPTSGADPLARREFWQRITALAEDGVTVVITTHFMEEAEYCDRVVIQDAGTILAEGAPADIRAHGETAGGRQVTMEDAFIAIVEKARNAAAGRHRDG